MTISNMFSLVGKKAIVTGGGRGLGLEMSQALAEAGADVAITYVTSDKTHDTAANIAKEYNVTCKAYKADLGDLEQLTPALEQIFQEFGQIDIFVANAAIAYQGPAEDITMDDWKRMFDVNVHGTFYGVQAAGIRMLKQGKGSIILISSISGAVANRPQSHCVYNATKGAVTMLTKCLSEEWATRGVRVNSINPGYMATEMLVDVAGSHGNLMAEWEKSIPMARLGRPDELKGTVVYLASDASSYVTGAQIFVDGGYTSV